MIKEAIIICTVEAVLFSVFASEGLRPEDLLPSGAVFKRKNLTAHFSLSSDQPGADALQHLIVGSEQYGALDNARGQNYEAEYQIASTGLSPEQLVEGTHDNSVAQESYRNVNVDVEMSHVKPADVGVQSHVIDNHMTGIENFEAHSQPSNVDVQTNFKIDPAIREVSMQVSDITDTEYGSEVIYQSSVLGLSDKPLAQPLIQEDSPDISPEGQYLPPKEPVTELPQTESTTITAPTSESPVHPEGEYLPPKEPVPELPQTEFPTSATPTNESPVHPEGQYLPPQEPAPALPQTESPTSTTPTNESPVHPELGQPTPMEEPQPPYPTFLPTTTTQQPSQSQSTYIPIEIPQQPIQSESTDIPTQVPQQPHPEPTTFPTEVPQQTIQAQSTEASFQPEPTQAPQQPIVPEQPYIPTQAPQEPFHPENPYVPMGNPTQQPPLPDNTYLPPNRPAEAVQPDSQPGPAEPSQQPQEPGSYLPSVPEKPGNSYGPQHSHFTEDSFIEVPVQYGPSSKDAIVHYVTHPSGGSSQYHDSHHNHDDHGGHHHNPHRYYNGQIKQVEDRFGLSLDPYFGDNQPQSTSRPYGPPDSTSVVNHRSILDFNFNPSDIYKAELITRGRSADNYNKRNGVYRGSSYEYFLFA